MDRISDLADNPIDDAEEDEKMDKLNKLRNKLKRGLHNADDN